jgi:hypothetical protein
VDNASGYGPSQEPFKFPAVHEMREDEYRQQRDRVEHAQELDTPHDVYADRPRDIVRFD